MIYDKMSDCFATLNKKINYCLDNSDLDAIFATLSSIKGNTIVTGCGGSSVVATFLAKVLREKNGIAADFCFPRDLQYMNLTGYENVVCVSYSGNNIGVDASFDNNLKHYLFTGRAKQDCYNMVYKIIKEESYVSISATLAPLALILMYYKNDRVILEEILQSNYDFSFKNNCLEVMGGYESLSANMMLESSLVESSLGLAIIHDKYNYCHGRINLSRNKMSDMLFFYRHNGLDEILLKTINKYYDVVNVIEEKYHDVVLDDFYFTYLSLLYIKQLAEKHNFDISDMQELPDNDDLYLYKGSMS